MPARSVAFANLRGGCGKSTILFQLASEFAKVRRTARGSRSLHLEVMQAAPTAALPAADYTTQHNTPGARQHRGAGHRLHRLWRRQPPAAGRAPAARQGRRGGAALGRPLLRAPAQPAAASCGCRGCRRPLSAPHAWAAGGGRRRRPRRGLLGGRQRGGRRRHRRARWPARVPGAPLQGGGWLARAAARVRAGCWLSRRRCVPASCPSPKGAHIRTRHRRSTRTSRCPTCC